MKTKIYILRHSETNYNVEQRHDHEWKAVLTEKWKQRAEVLPELLRDQKISTIYSSPLSRCIDTLTPLADYLDKKIILDERIRENFLWPMQDRFWSDFPKDFLDEVHDLNGWRHKGYEHMRDVKARVSEFIDSVVEKHKWESIIVCSHGGPIFHILSHIDKISSNATRVEVITNTGITHKDAYILREI